MRSNEVSRQGERAPRRRHRACCEGIQTGTGHALGTRCCEGTGEERIGRCSFAARRGFGAGLDALNVQPTGLVLRNYTLRHATRLSDVIEFINHEKKEGLACCGFENRFCSKYVAIKGSEDRQYPHSSKCVHYLHSIVWEGIKRAIYFEQFVWFRFTVQSRKRIGQSSLLLARDSNTKNVVLQRKPFQAPYTDMKLVPIQPHILIN